MMIMYFWLKYMSIMINNLYAADHKYIHVLAFYKKSEKNDFLTHEQF